MRNISEFLNDGDPQKIYAKDDRMGKENIEIVPFDDAVGINISGRDSKSPTVDFSPEEVRHIIAKLESSLTLIAKLKTNLRGTK